MSKWQYSLALLCIVGCFLSAAGILTRHSVVDLTLSDFSEYSCTTGTAAENSLKLHLSVPIYIQSFAETLCQSALIQQNYSSVTVSWKPREEVTALDIIDMEFALLMGRKHAFTGLVPAFESLYVPLEPNVNFTQYQVYWYSRTPFIDDPKIQLLGKRIGVISDNVSHTHYLLPLTALAEAQIHLDQIELTYYPNGYKLYEAFRSGEVDIISGGSWLQQELGEPIYKSLITAEANIGDIFIDKRLSLALQCEIYKAIQPMITFINQLAQNQQPHLETPMIKSVSC